MTGQCGDIRLPSRVSISGNSEGRSQMTGTHGICEAFPTPASPFTLSLCPVTTFTFPKVLIPAQLPNNLPASKPPSRNLCPTEPQLQHMHYLICSSPPPQQFYYHLYFTEETQALRTSAHSVVLDPILLTKMDKQTLIPAIEFCKYPTG